MSCKPQTNIRDVSCKTDPVYIDCRKMDIGSNKRISIQYDNNSSKKVFLLPLQDENGVSFVDKDIFVETRCENGRTNKVKINSPILKENNIEVHWSPSVLDTLEAGNLDVQIIVAGADYTWHSEIAKFYIHQSIGADKNLYKRYPDVFHQIFHELNTLKIESVYPDEETLISTKGVVGLSGKEKALAGQVFGKKEDGTYGFIEPTSLDGLVLSVNDQKADARGNVSLTTSLIPNDSSYVNRSEMQSYAVPLTEKGVAGGVATLGVNSKVPNDQLNTDVVVDNSYVHTDNNFTTTEKNKLNGIENNAQVNKIETIKINGTLQSILDKSVDLEIPTKVSEFTNDSKYQNDVEVSNIFAKLITNYYDRQIMDEKLRKKANLVGGKIPLDEIPLDLIKRTWTVQNVSDLTTLTEAHTGDTATVTSMNEVYILVKEPAIVSSNWEDITNAGGVISVNGRTGVVTLSISDIPTLSTTIQEITDNIDTHKANKENPHNVTKEQIGLSNVTNDKQIPATEKGVAGGVATLNSTGKLVEVALNSEALGGKASSDYALKSSLGSLAGKNTVGANEIDNGSVTEQKLDVALQNRITTMEQEFVKPSGFAKITNGVWDLNKNHKVILEADLTSLTNVKNGEIGYAISKIDLTLPQNSKKAYDYDALTIDIGEAYHYTFVYDGTNYYWQRTIWNI